MVLFDVLFIRWSSKSGVVSTFLEFGLGLRIQRKIDDPLTLAVPVVVLFMCVVLGDAYGFQTGDPYKMVGVSEQPCLGVNH